jgi:hypothetical protein
MPNNTRRNWVARLPIMKKGGVHDKTNKAKRQKNKQMLKKQLRVNKFGPYSFLKQKFLKQAMTTAISSI